MTTPCLAGIPWDDQADIVTVAIKALGTDDEIRRAAQEWSNPYRVLRGRHLLALASRLNDLAGLITENMPSLDVQLNLEAIEIAACNLDEHEQLDSIVARWDQGSRTDAQARIRSTIQTLQSVDAFLTAKNEVGVLPEGYVALE